MILSENQNLGNDVSEVRMVQFEEDNFEGIQFMYVSQRLHK